MTVLSQPWDYCLALLLLGIYRLFVQESGKVKNYLVIRIWRNVKGVYNRSVMMLSALCPNVTRVRGDSACKRRLIDW